jgi:Fe-S-cluster containining protein
MTRLPVLDAASRICLSCHGPCCFEHAVPVTGYDLWRLTANLGVPWASLVELGFEKSALYDGFRLDRGPKHYHFTLKRRASGACEFLLELGDAYRRCGVHALRPGACRRYPLVPSDVPDGVEFGNHAICPEPQAARYRAALVELRPQAEEPDAEHGLYRHLLSRWDLLARFVPVETPLTVDQFCDWAAGVYQAIEPLREGARADWQPRAEKLVEEFPLPDVSASSAPAR